MSTLLASDIRRAQADPSLVHVGKYADHYVVSVHDDAKSIIFCYAAATTTIGYVRLRRGERGIGDRWEYRLEGDSEFRGMDAKTRKQAVKDLLGDVVRKLNRVEQPGGYLPAHPVSVTAIVKLSNGRQFDIEISETESSEKGDAYGAIFPSAVLSGHLTRTVQKCLRGARESAEAYGR